MINKKKLQLLWNNLCLSPINIFNTESLFLLYLIYSVIITVFNGFKLLRFLPLYAWKTRANIQYLHRWKYFTKWNL